MFCDRINLIIQETYDGCSERKLRLVDVDKGKLRLVDVPSSGAKCEINRSIISFVRMHRARTRFPRNPSCLLNQPRSNYA